MTEIPLNGNVYRIGRLDAMQQFHIARKLAPILATMGSQVVALKGGPDMDQDDWLMQMLEPVSKVAAAMSEEDVNYVVQKALTVVHRQDDGRWAAVQKGTALMYQDIELPTMFRLVVEVVKENLGGFFKEVSGGIV